VQDSLIGAEVSELVLVVVVALCREGALKLALELALAEHSPEAM
jgi:hypothetical protein